jgi:PDZ domain-containing protein
VRPWRTLAFFPFNKRIPVALFADSDPVVRPRRSRGSTVGWSLILLAMLVTIVVALVPSPYVIEQPGPVFDTLGEVEVGGDEVPLIDIADATTYPTSGSLNMLTVSINGNRDNRLNWFQVASAWFDSSKAVVPLDSVYPAGVSVEQSNEQSQTDMQNSQQEAIAAALSQLDYDFTTTLEVVDVGKGTPADGQLEAGDTIVSVDGQTFSDVTGLKATIADNGVDTPATVVVERDGVEQTLAITPVMSTGATPAPIVGITVKGNFVFPIDVTIQLENVGGPSAGQMFALGIIDKLTPGELTGGQDVAGTGTITGDGTIGPIGGIRQKMYGAVRAGADYFLAPVDNCDEVVGHVPDGLDVFAVTTLDDSLAVLDAVSTGGSTADLPTCDAN